MFVCDDCGSTLDTGDVCMDKLSAEVGVSCACGAKYIVAYAICRVWKLKTMPQGEED